MRETERSRRGPRDLSQAEWTVMNAAWAIDGEVTARQVLDQVSESTGWAYTTVKTMMDRLVDKGVLASRRSGKTTMYSSSLTRGNARWTAARSLADRAFGGALVPLVHFLVSSESLSDGDRDELRRMLDAIEREDTD